MSKKYVFCKELDEGYEEGSGEGFIKKNEYGSDSDSSLETKPDTSFEMSKKWKKYI